MCTGIRFADSAGTMYFGRNLDWTTSYGERVVVTPPAAKVPAAFERAGDPERGHAVIGMGIIVEGIPLYFDCGNDAGLAVAGLNFPQSAHYATEPAPTGVNVAAYEFPFWVARNFATLDEVRAALENVTVVARAVNDELPVANLHWIIGDETGSIAVECLEDGMRVWEDDVDVLTNEPTFCWHRQPAQLHLAHRGRARARHVGQSRARSVRLRPRHAGHPGRLQRPGSIREGGFRQRPLPRAGVRGR